MKKIGLVCNYYMLNYGSILQCYATERFVQKCGYDIEAIRFENIPTRSGKIQQFIRLRIRQFFKPSAIAKKLERMKNTGSNEVYIKLREKRKEKFDKFNNENLRFSPQFGSLEEVANEVKRYDIVLLGSDQLLCPKDIIFGYHTLRFVPEDIKKISYAASFGLEKLPRAVRGMAKKDLARFDCFAAREDAGAKIYKELTGKETQVVVDPTLLLSREEWENVADKERMVEEPYIFSYLIGSTKEHRDIVNGLKSNTDLKIATIRHIDDFIEEDENFGDIALNDAGPKDFIRLIRDAEYVVADSFHATIFSIIFHKKFVVLNRFPTGSKESTNSRLDSLLGRLGLEDRRAYSMQDLDRILKSSIDYTKVDAVLKPWVEESKDYLREAAKC